MQNKFFIFVSSVFISYAFLFPFTVPAHALGQITQPIEIKDAQKGSVYKEELTIINTEDKKIKARFETEGAIEEWTKYYFSQNATTTAGEFEMEPREKRIAFAVITIATGTPNGEYSGTLSVRKIVEKAEKKEDSSASSIDQKISRPIKITVGGEEKVEFSANLIPEKYDFKKDEPIRIRVIYENKGNTDIAPQIQIRVMQDQELKDTIIVPFTGNEPAISPGEIREIKEIEYLTNKLPEGTYRAYFDFLIKEEKKHEQNFGFTIGASEKTPSTAEPSSTPGTSQPYILLGIAGVLILAAGALAFIAKKKS